MCRAMTKMLLAVFLLGGGFWARAQETEQEKAPGASAKDQELERLEQDAKRARLEAERAKAEAERIRAEAERAKAEAELLRARQEKKRLMQSRRPPRMRRRRPAYRRRWPPPPPPGPPPGAFTHDGFFLRLTLGPGFGGYNSTGHIRLSGSGQVLTAPGDQGMIGGGGISLGGSVGGGFIIHGDLWGAIQLADTDYDQLEQVGLGVIGFGATYYFMPVNIYLTVSVGLATAMSDDGETLYYDGYDYGYYHGNSNRHLGTGVGIMLGCGKEWWVSPNWGLGFAVNGYFAYGEGNDFVIRQAGMQIAFSASFN